jgi:GT2 family glycosyltransferase
MSRENRLPSAPFVSVVVPTYRRPTVLASTLDALLAVEHPAERYEVIVVDDGPDDATERAVKGSADARAATDRVVYVAQHRGGAATARNTGARRASGQVLIFVDDDITVRPDHVNRHLAVLCDDRQALVNGHWEFSPPVRAALEATPFGRFRIEVEEWVKDTLPKETLEGGRVVPSAVTACNLGVWRDFFWTVGGFDEGFPFAGYEDQEFSYRAVAAGASLYYDRSIRLLHNDQRMTLEQFCGRQRQGAMTAALLATKHPEFFGDRALITENRPIDRRDAPPVVAKKLAKQVVATPPGLAILASVVRSTERVVPNSRLLRRLYWAMCGIYIFMGVRDGFSRPSAPVGVLAPN